MQTHAKAGPQCRDVRQYEVVHSQYLPVLANTKPITFPQSGEKNCEELGLYILAIS
jgi:hypothetical protein